MLVATVPIRYMAWPLPYMANCRTVCQIGADMRDKSFQTRLVGCLIFRNDLIRPLPISISKVETGKNESVVFFGSDPQKKTNEHRNSA